MSSSEVWLDATFSQLWQGQDVFVAARRIEGETQRQLEQRQTLAFTEAGKRYFIKRHQGAPLREIVKNLLSLRLPVVSAHNEFTALAALRAAGVLAPVVAAYGRKGLLPAQLESFLVTADVGPHQSLEDYCRPWRNQPPAVADKLALIKQVAEISRRMHGAGVCHRDFYLCHFLRLEGTGELVLIDLHRALVKSRLGRRWIIKDLAGLLFSALDIGLTQRDLLRFVRLYRQRSLRATLQTEAGFWQTVQSKAQLLYNKHHRRDAP